MRRLRWEVRTLVNIAVVTARLFMLALIAWGSLRGHLVPVVVGLAAFGAFSEWGYLFNRGPAEHERTLRNIARLERELGIREPRSEATKRRR